MKENKKWTSDAKATYGIIIFDSNPNLHSGCTIFRDHEIYMKIIGDERLASLAYDLDFTCNWKYTNGKVVYFEHNYDDEFYHSIVDSKDLRIIIKAFIKKIEEVLSQNIDKTKNNVLFYELDDRIHTQYSYNDYVSEQKNRNVFSSKRGNIPEFFPTNIFLELYGEKNSQKFFWSFPFNSSIYFEK